MHNALCGLYNDDPHVLSCSCIWYVVQIYETSELSEEKVRALRVLGHVKDADRMEQVLKFSISVSHVYLIIDYT